MYPKNNSFQLGGEEIGQLSFLSSNQPRNVSFPLVLSSQTLHSFLPFFSFSFLSFLFFFFLLLWITFLCKSPPASCSCISQYGLPNYPHCCCTLHADGIKLSVGGPLPSLKNVIPNQEKICSPQVLTTKGGLQICPSSVEFTSVRSMSIEMKWECEGRVKRSELYRRIKETPIGTLVEHGLTRVNRRT